MTTKPPLGCRMILLCAAELGVTAAIITKVVFTWHRTWICLKLAASGRAVSMQEIAVSSLPEWRREMYSCVLPNVDVFHFKALSSPQKIDDVEVLEVATDVVSEIDAMGWIAARCSPVSGVTLQGCHSYQAQAIQINSSSESSHLLGRYIWRECYERKEAFGESCSRTSPMSRQYRALTSYRNKLDSCYQRCRRVCRYHIWRHLFQGNQGRSKDGRYL